MLNRENAPLSLLLALLCILSTNNVHSWTLSSSSSSHSLKHRCGISKTKNNNNILARYASAQSTALPGYELFQDGPYVPLGLSAQEYENIKQKEKEKEAKMEYAAWGPRFKRISAPSGDWMVMPHLWTKGMVDVPILRASNSANDERENESNYPRSKRARLSLRVKKTMNMIRQGYLGFILAYVAIDVIMTAMTMIKASEMKAISVIVSILRLLLLNNSREVLFQAMWKLQVMKLCVASIGAPAANRFLEHMNRNRLWSKRKTMIVSIGSSFGALALLGGFLKLVR